MASRSLEKRFLGWCQTSVPQLNDITRVDPSYPYGPLRVLTLHLGVFPLLVQHHGELKVNPWDFIGYIAPKRLIDHLRYYSASLARFRMRPAGTTSKKRGAEARRTFCTMCVWVPAAMRTMIMVNLRSWGVGIQVLSEIDKVGA